MTTDGIEPMVPVMPTETTTDTVRADGGRLKRYGRQDVAAAIVPDLR